MGTSSPSHKCRLSVRPKGCLGDRDRQRSWLMWQLDSGEREIENKPSNKHTRGFYLVISAVQKIPQGVRQRDWRLGWDG